MKTFKPTLLMLALITGFFLFRSSAQERSTHLPFEYATIRWAGKENTHLIRPGGQVEFIGAELRKLIRPDRCDERSFFMNAAMNGMAKDGWEFASMTPDEIVMRRVVGR